MKYIKMLNVVILLIFSLFITPVFSQTASNSMDHTITGLIQSRLASDQVLANSHVRVSTHNNVVELSGTVNSEAAANRLISIAQSVTDVKDVDTSHLKVKNGKEKFSDMVITAKIEGLYLRSGLFGNFSTSVISVYIHTLNGVVSLSGTVNNQQQLDNAIEIAKLVHGVKKVESSIKIYK